MDHGVRKDFEAAASSKRRERLAGGLNVDQLLKRQPHSAARQEQKEEEETLYDQNVISQRKRKLDMIEDMINKRKKKLRTTTKRVVEEERQREEEEWQRRGGRGGGPEESNHEAPGIAGQLWKDKNSNNSNSTSTPVTAVPFVIMVFKRVEYLQQLMESLRNSDFPQDQSVPIVISHDGHVPEMVDYVNSLLRENNNNDTGFEIIQLFHPYSCFDHPHSFPGNDTSLNIGYQGDRYGNPRSEWATCCKHHFTWMMNTVFTLEQLKEYDTFFFLEEDYVVARTIYSSVVAGVQIMDKTDPFLMDRYGSGFFGLSVDYTNAGKSFAEKKLAPQGTFRWTWNRFRTGPMTLNRKVYTMIQSIGREYCLGFDEYNWDWTLVDLMVHRLLNPYLVLVPSRVPLVQHIGELGMHTSEHATVRDVYRRHLALPDSLQSFLSSQWVPSTELAPAMLERNPPVRSVRKKKLSGGWNHPLDLLHCQTLFAMNDETVKVQQLKQQDHQLTNNKSTAELQAMLELEKSKMAYIEEHHANLELQQDVEQDEEEEEEEGSMFVFTKGWRARLGERLARSMAQGKHLLDEIFLVAVIVVVLAIAIISQVERCLDFF